MPWRPMQTAFTAHQTLSFSVANAGEMYYPLSTVSRAYISQNNLSDPKGNISPDGTNKKIYGEGTLELTGSF